MADTVARRTGILRRILDLIGSVRFGVTMMALVLAYCWIGSAGTTPFGHWFVRQTFEKTEMEWFNWWPFHLLLALTALSIIVVTVRRIRPTLPNLGVITVHAGVLVLMLGGVTYFGLKLEGDMIVYRRQVVGRAAGGPETKLVVQPGMRATVQNGRLIYHLRILGINPSYELLTGDDRGKKTFSVQVRVDPYEDGSPRPAFVRQLLAGYPQYTEDVIPGQGRAVKAIGRKIVDDRLELGLDYAPADRLYLKDRRALHVRLGRDGEFVELPLPGLPRYHEYVGDPEEILTGLGRALPAARPLHLRPSARGEMPAGAPEIEVTGFLPYATLEERWEPGGDRRNPMIEFSLSSGGAVATGRLLASRRRGTTLTLGGRPVRAAFRWVEGREQGAPAPEPGELLFVGGPGRLEARYADPGGGSVSATVRPGEPVELPGTGLTVLVDTFAERAQRVYRPRLIPREERDLKAGARFSMIEVTLRDGGEQQRLWLPYSHYLHPSRYGYFPRTVVVRRGQPVDLVFSRETRRLAQPVALEDFRLETYPGRDRERDFISLVRFFENGHWSEIHEVRSNKPTAHGGFWFFQSTWDPPAPMFGYPGLNHTGLGVGNRHGVLAMLGGAAMIVFGTLWAFYVKPLILRRRRDARRARAEAAPAPPARSAPPEGDERPELEPAAAAGRER